MIIGIAGLLPPRLYAQDKSPVLFSKMEREHIRVATPGLFASDNELYLHFDTLSMSQWCFPLPGARLISDYGRGGRHSGVDIKTHAGDTIRAAFDGVVRLSRTYGAYGKVIVIRHASGLETIYSHNARNLVDVGERVRVGQAIGLVGRTGRATTEHLHFETRINGQHFNPHILYNIRENRLRDECIKCTRKSGGIVVKPVKKEQMEAAKEMPVKY